MPSVNNRAHKRTAGEMTGSNSSDSMATRTRSRRNVGMQTGVAVREAPVRVTAEVPEPVVAVGQPIVNNIPRVVKKSRSRPKIKLVNDKFDKSDALKWFKHLCEVDANETSNRIGPSGIQQLAKEIDKDVGDVVFLVLAWKMEAKEMGWFTEEEWMKGMTELQIDCPSKLSAMWKYLRGLLDSRDTFRNVYRYAYDFTKGNEGYCRHLETKIAQELIKLFLEKKWTLCVDFCEFLDSTKVRVINKDQFNNVLEFFLLVKDDCSDYDMNSAWPVMMDDFVTYLLKRKFDELEESKDEALDSN